jgi:hypothetical protein
MEQRGGFHGSIEEAPENWQQEYAESKDAITNVPVPRQLLYKTTIGELLEDFARYVDQPDVENRLTPRLALVLSGGGAKCAYQAGAISAIEAKLREINEARAKASPSPKPPIDINLVVGTSGGAINALLVASGVTKAKNAPGELAELWGSFRQQQFFSTIVPLQSRLRIVLWSPASALNHHRSSTFRP